jgi:hypothetical protein
LSSIARTVICARASRRKSDRQKRSAGVSCQAGAHAGVVAFSRSGDPATGEFSDAEILSETGDVDLDALSA